MSRIILVTGGARSGKSLFAERYAERLGSTVSYIATAQVYDDEMRIRVDRHKQRRPVNWLTFEAPCHADAIICEAAKSSDIVLFDCLTLYTANLLLANEAPQDAEKRYAFVMNEIEKLADSAVQVNKTIIFVTNEVGLGIVPENALAREYRDLAGMVNQKIAAKADEVYLVVSGLAVEIKKLAANLSEV